MFCYRLTESSLELSTTQNFVKTLFVGGGFIFFFFLFFRNVTFSSFFYNFLFLSPRKKDEILITISLVQFLCNMGRKIRYLRIWKRELSRDSETCKMTKEMTLISKQAGLTAKKWEMVDVLFFL